MTGAKAVIRTGVTGVPNRRGSYRIAQDREIAVMDADEFVEEYFT